MIIFTLEVHTFRSSLSEHGKHGDVDKTTTDSKQSK